ncbi:hypothetical protein [Noviherbaspirillum sp.]|uniref:hypothetical protein n=1 Tax=Noviherbaspirillum sp. TaxID=1926288 RepID=UPI002FE372EE
MDQTMSLDRRLDVQMALAVVLQSMSHSAVEGLTLRRTQAVVEHLRALATSPIVSSELRDTCRELGKVWQSIDVV